MRLSGRVTVVLGAVVGIMVIAATDRILPAATPYQAQMRVWLAARATGIVAYLALTFVVALGLILSHPVNQSTWKLSKRLFPWHENLFVFVVAFVAAHIVGIVLDPYADVGLVGSFVPGASSFRPLPVALGSLALYALLITGLTARYMKLLPTGWWLKIHRREPRRVRAHVGTRDARRDGLGCASRHVRRLRRRDRVGRGVSLLGRQEATTDVREQPARCRGYPAPGR